MATLILGNCSSNTTDPVNGVPSAPMVPTQTDSARYSAAAAYSDSAAGDALLVIKNGVTVFERYNAPTTAATFHMLASGTKSFTCAV